MKQKAVMSAVLRRALAMGFISSALAAPSAFAANALSWSASAGLGYDSNPYRTPNDTYWDYSLTPPVEVPPDKQSGFYLDVDAGADYRLAQRGASNWWLGYDLDLIQYFDTALDNANEYKHVFSLDWENVFAQQGVRKESLTIGGYVGLVKDLYYDRDSGEEQTVGTGPATTDISDRYSYQSIGVAAEYKDRLSTLKYQVSGRYEVRDYEDPKVVDQYDHTRFELGGEVSYPLAKQTDLSAGYTYKNLDYDERNARDKDGRLLNSNGTLNYVYSIFDVSLRQRLSDQWVMYFDVSHTLRTDEFEAYNDYTKNEFKVRALYRPSDVLDMKFSAAVWQRDYDNAYSFDEPPTPTILTEQKEYSGYDLGFKARLKRDETSLWWSRLDYTAEDSSDERYAYDRLQLLVGMEWEFN